MKNLQSTPLNFAAKLKNYKSLLDADIATFSTQAASDVHEQFGTYPAEAVEAYVSLLSRGGKRIRGALTMLAYEMSGGTDLQVAVSAGRAIEMLHAYILIIDDIQDRSESRRGGPTAHFMLKQFHESHHLKGSSLHFGESIALNGSLFGVHQAISILADLPVDPEIRLKAINNVNKHFIATAHGQSLDIFNEVVESVAESDVDKVLLWKTAFYTFMNPLQLGAIIAGADDGMVTQLAEFSLHAGRVFQITDDIIGVFGNESDAGKNPMDDIREGKRTLLTVKALELAPKADVYYLESMLGNSNLTTAEFERCRKIINDSGALEYAKSAAETSAKLAVEALQPLAGNWSAEGIDFLSQLTETMLNRKS